jgi:hypothetical protein
MKTIICAVLSIVALSGGSVQAAADLYQGSAVQTGQLITTSYIGTYGLQGGNDNPSVASINTTAGFDWSAMTMKLSDYSGTVGSMQRTQVRDVTVGPGSVKRISLEVSSAPFSFSATGFQNAPLVLGTLGQYNFADPFAFKQGTYGHLQTIQLSVHYSITGPTEQKTGDFIVSLSSEAPWAMQQFDYVDTSDYPTSLELHAPTPASFYWSTHNHTQWDVDTTVDGVPVRFRIQDCAVESPSFTMAAVPEPTTLFILSLGGLTLLRRRK